MIEVLQILLGGGLIYGICYIVNVIGKCIVTKMILNHNELSDNKVSSLTKMMSKDININSHQ